MKETEEKRILNKEWLKNPETIFSIEIFYEKSWFFGIYIVFFSASIFSP